MNKQEKLLKIMFFQRNHLPASGGCEWLSYGRASTIKILSRQFSKNHRLKTILNSASELRHYFNTVPLFLFFILFFTSWNFVSATTFQSSNYIIDYGTLNITGGKKTSSSFNLTDTVGQNAPGSYTSTGYQIKSGFQYIYDPNWKFVFTIDKLNIDFTNLTPGIGITDTNIISIASPSLGGYQIMVQANHSLQSNSTTSIADTSCNNSSCTITTSGIWNDSNSYGFGFNTIGVNTSLAPTGVGTSNYFSTINHFRPFSNRSLNQPLQTIMSESRPTKKSYARITYRLNIPVFQTSGKYENSVTYIAIPKY